LTCRLRVIQTGKKRLPKFEVQTEREGSREILEGKQTAEGHLEYELFGDRAVTVRWTVSQLSSAQGNGARKRKKGEKK
jgi:hypothetical protein